MNCNTLEKSKRLLSGGAEEGGGGNIENEDLYLLTDKAQSCLYGGAWVLLWGRGGSVPAPGDAAVCLENIDSQSVLKGSLLKTSLVSPPVNEV